MYLKTNALVDLLVEVKCSRTHTIVPMANLAYKEKLSSRIEAAQVGTGHVLRMWEKRFSRATLEFQKGPSLRRPRRGFKPSWWKAGANDLEEHFRPRNIIKQKWNENWLEICFEAANNRARWRTVMRDIHIAGDGHWCPSHKENVKEEWIEIVLNLFLTSWIGHLLPKLQ